MENDCGLAFVYQERGNQNALNSPHLDLLHANCEAFLHPDCVSSYDWENTLLDIKQLIPRPDSRDKALIQAQAWAGDFLSKPFVDELPNYPKNGRSSNRRQACTFDGCRSTAFRTMCDLKMHMSRHSNDIMCQWVDGQMQHCIWPSCSSKATFKSKRTLQTHLENIHVDPLRCPEKGCVYKTPFRSNYDLKRHVRTIHYGDKELQFQCPFRQCSIFPKTFIRKDKWLNHLRSEHDDANCPLNHCEAITTGTLVEHVKNFHGNFECHIGSCGQQSASRFAKFELMKHLEFHHGIQGGDINIAQNAAIQARDGCVRSEDLSGMASWVDCLSCLERGGVLAMDMEEVICLDRENDGL